ncbi:Tetraspannin [Oryctes borbonicus]|uniref:Tetraspannin n=1 Tax=Oryctes borbonicus TaxID=1629725 RepID=A0A0T6B8L0_9SCAR|nr:Tetraspannin [Oryctes borbonicus]
MSRISLVVSKTLLAFCNFLLLGSGCTLVPGGLLIILDPERVLLSRLMSSGTLTALSHSLLYYLGLGLAVLGFILAGTGVLGCWASCLHSYCMLALVIIRKRKSNFLFNIFQYFALIMLVLIGECAVYTIAWAWPQCLGLGLIPQELAKSLQRNYGVGGQEQFTAAVDLAQTLFKCCGVLSANEYDTSVWRLQSLGPPLAVPLTCCRLENLKSSNAYLDPNPVNNTLCQLSRKDLQQGFRHVPGCSQHLEQWYKEQYIIFLAVGLLVVLIEFAVLLCTVLACAKLFTSKQTKEAKPKTEHEMTAMPKSPMAIASTSNFQRAPLPYSNNVYTLTNSFRQNYKLMDKA